jgi:hypothetical protein
LHSLRAIHNLKPTVLKFCAEEEWYGKAEEYRFNELPLSRMFPYELALIVRNKKIALLESLYKNANCVFLRIVVNNTLLLKKLLLGLSFD